MQVHHEIVDKEDYIDILISRDELAYIKDNFLLAECVNMFGKKINVGIALVFKSENKNASHQKQKQESHQTKH